MRKKIAKNSIVLFIILLLCLLLSYAFLEFQVRKENIIMIYLIGVLFVTVETRELAWGILASILSILLFNYCFTEPYYTLLVNDPNYYITFSFFLIVSLVSGTLASKLQRHVDIAKKNELRVSNLYEISSSYLNVSKVESIIRKSLENFAKITKNPVVIYVAKDFDQLSAPCFDSILCKDITIYEDDPAVLWCFKNVCVCGMHQANFQNSKWFYIPIKSQNRVLGVFGIYSEEMQAVENDDMILIKTVIYQMALSLERETLVQQQEESKLQIEKEKLRNTLLRSVSHDLRTPLTGIAGSSSLILDSYDKLNKENIIDLVTSIKDDALWLNSLVENLLNMTRIQEGKLMIQKESEVVEDLVVELFKRIQPILRNHQFEMHLPEELLLVSGDGKLIIQVLINLISNAIQHNYEDSKIILEVERKNFMIRFAVVDNGGGIKEELIPNLFDNFVTSKSQSGDSYRGIGLGLSICKSIVEAHGGSISAYNNELGGATFEFMLNEGEPTWEN